MIRVGKSIEKFRLAQLKEKLSGQKIKSKCFELKKTEVTVMIPY